MKEAQWVSAPVTESIEDMIASASGEADRRDPQRDRQRVFLAGGNKQQITAIGDHARERGLKVPVLIEDIHVSGYIGKAAAALHPGDPAAAGQWADGQRLRVLHGRAKAVAATLKSVAAKTRSSPRTRHLDLTDMDKAVTYLTNNHMHMRYCGRALARHRLVVHDQAAPAAGTGRVHAGSPSGSSTDTTNPPACIGPAGSDPPSSATSSRIPVRPWRRPRSCPDRMGGVPRPLATRSWTARAS